MVSFEEFINRKDIEVIQVDVKAVERSHMFQQNFAAVVLYRQEVKQEIEKLWVNKYLNKYHHIPLYGWMKKIKNKLVLSGCFQATNNYIMT